MKQTSEIIIRIEFPNLEIDAPWLEAGLNSETEAYFFDVFKQKIFDLLTMQQKAEWCDEDFAVKIPDDKIEIKFRAVFPEAGESGEEIELIAGDFKNLDEIKLANHFFEEIFKSYNVRSIYDDTEHECSDDDDDCGCCCGCE